MTNTGREKMCWFDLITLNLLSQYELDISYRSHKIQCIHPIHSPKHTVAVGIALHKRLSEQNTENEICIIQAGVIQNSKQNSNDIDIELDHEVKVSIVHALLSSRRL